VLLHDVIVGAQCVVRADKITGPTVFWHHKFTAICHAYSDNISSTCAWLQQNTCLVSARQCNISHHNQLFALLRQYFLWQNNKQGIVAFCSPDLNPCNFYLWGMWNDKVYSNNRHMEDDLKTRSIQDVVSSVSPAGIQCTINNTFVIRDEHHWIEGNLF